MKKLITSAAVAAMLSAQVVQAAETFIPGAKASAVLAKFTATSERFGWRLTVKSPGGRSFDTAVSPDLLAESKAAGVDPIANIVAIDTDRGVLVRLRGGFFFHASGTIEMEDAGPSDDALQAILDNLHDRIAKEGKGAR